MQENWRDLYDFPGYIISNQGRVRSAYSNRCLVQRYNSEDVPLVSMSIDGRQYQRSVPLLVAKEWLPEPEREDFISPIHLDGVRRNCCVDNLAWRPRWFSIAFHKERLQNPFPNWNGEIEIIETGEIFTSPREYSMKYGVLEIDVYLSIANGKHVFPQWFHVRYV